ncbi:hypothetical protein [Nocardioides sp. GXQ0305]|uniref:hypothetical protein n=1 Tax=Nocardioides sp. GXQ0305 TaxID=3423912 RepID=UPI003D7E4420
MDSDDLERMYMQIVRGVPKDRSRLVTDAESSALWDQVAREVADARTSGVAQFGTLAGRDSDDLEARYRESRRGGAEHWEVERLLDALIRGELTLERVESLFRARAWPERGRPAATLADAFADRQPDSPGSFAEVAQAYYDGRIDLSTYERLVNAAAESR